ncbi:MAG: AEC family transporter [Gammaproteobacteria bacterium]|nr:AEC family transporter [Gammaproteobacteria bacterium]
MIQQIFSIVFPVFSIVLVGYLYGRKHLPDMAAANKINIEVFTPALIFSVLSGKNFNLAEFYSLAFGAALVVLGSGLLAWPVARLMNFDVKTFVPPAMFTNSGNMGLPLALFAFGETALPAAIMLFIVENTLHFTVGMKMINRQASLVEILRLPMVLATFAGLLVSLMAIEIPSVVLQPIDMIGQVAIPLMLFSLGVRLLNIDYRDWKIGLTSALVTPISGVLIAIVFLALVELPKDQLALFLLFSVLPPAVLNFMIAEKFNQEPARVASIVMIGNLGSIVSIPLILLFVLISA